MSSSPESADTPKHGPLGGSSSSRRARASAGGTSQRFSAARIERELVAYLHEEETDVPYAVIERAIQADPRVRKSWEELQAVARAMAYIPSAGPSWRFVRDVMRRLPELEAAGTATERFSDMMRRTKWSLEDRIAFSVEYWRYRFRHHPASSVLVTAALLLLVVTAAWLPGVLLMPQDQIPFSGSDSPSALLGNEEGNAIDVIGPIPSLRSSSDDEAETAWRQPEPFLPSEGPAVVPGETIEREPFDREPTALDGTHRPIHVPDDMPTNGGARLVPSEERVLPWYGMRAETDGRRGITPRERRLIEYALHALHDRQEPDGSWSDRPIPPAPDTAPAEENNSEPGQALPADPRGRDDAGTSEGRSSSADPLRDGVAPSRVQTTARVLQAFLAEAYASDRPALNLQPRHSNYSPWPAARFDDQVAAYNEGVAKGIEFILANQDADSGALAGFGDNDVVAHADALIALAEDTQITRSITHRMPMRHASRWLREQQNADGGWPATEGGESDLTATTLAIEALVLCTQADSIPASRYGSVFPKAARYLANCVKSDGYAEPTPGTTGTAVYRSTAAAGVMQSWLNAIGVTPVHPIPARNWPELRRTLTAEDYRPSIGTGAGSTSLVDWCWTAHAFADWPVMEDPIGRRAQERWRTDLGTLLEEAATIEPNLEVAIWLPADVRAPASASVEWTTATAVLTLQSPYRHLRATR